MHGNYTTNITNFISIGRIGLSSLSGLFSQSEFNGIIGPDWDTSNISDLSHMFGRAIKFDKPFGKNWDTSRVINMSYMFGSAESFNQPFGFSGKNGWDTSKVTDMSSMLYNASNFNQPFGLTNGLWNTSGVRKISSILYGATKFNLRINTNLDISKLEDAKFVFRTDVHFRHILTPLFPEYKK